MEWLAIWDMPSPDAYEQPSQGLANRSLPRDRQPFIEVLYADGRHEVIREYGASQADFASDLAKQPGVDRVLCHFAAREFRPPRDDSPPSLAESELKGYRWPASRLTRSDMQMLCEIRKLTGRPLTILLQEAIAVYYQSKTAVLKENAETRD